MQPKGDRPDAVQAARQPRLLPETRVGGLLPGAAFNDPAAYLLMNRHNAPNL